MEQRLTLYHLVYRYQAGTVRLKVHNHSNITAYTGIPTPYGSSTPSKHKSIPCKCATCTESILNSMAGDHSSGDRINWVQTSRGGSLSESEACVMIGRDEFPEVCGPCDPTSCETNTPSSSPTVAPPCSCPSCTDAILDTMAGDHTCGARISWLKSEDGGSLSEYEACSKVGKDDFPNECSACDPSSCNAPKRRMYLKGSR